MIAPLPFAAIADRPTIARAGPFVLDVQPVNGARWQWVIYDHDVGGWLWSSGFADMQRSPDAAAALGLAYLQKRLDAVGAQAIVAQHLPVALAGAIEAGRVVPAVIATCPSDADRAARATARRAAQLQRLQLASPIRARAPQDDASALPLFQRALL